MATEFPMPKLGLTMEEGTIVRWLVDDGDDVAQGTAVLLVETDKVETEVESPASGRLQRLGNEGDTFRCGEQIAWLLAAGEAPAPARATPSDAAAALAMAPAAASSVASSNGGALPPPAGVGAPAGERGRLLASPNGRRLAAKLGVDLATVVGTGPGGRIVSEDIERTAAALATAPAAAAPAAVAAPAAAAMPQPVAARPQAANAPLTQTATSIIPMKGMRATIATRMFSSLQSMAQLTLTMDVSMDAVWADREARKAKGAAPGFTDYVIAAAAQALRHHPQVNSQVTDEGIALLPDIHVGMAVALDNGLMVPVVRHTDRLRLDAIASETKRLAEAARNGKLSMDELAGGTFSVTSLGMYGVDAFTPVINPPNAAILGVGRIRDELVWADDGIKRARRMTLSLTWDHRVIDGAPAAEFCRAVATNLEDPTTIP
jgi:pyruvate dehydrogenase E2 component (dihydrolipoamide acetyltransferase)